MIRLTLLAAALFTTAAQAEPTCAQAYDLAHEAAQERDAGVPATSLFETINNHATADERTKHIARLAVETAYRYPTVTPKQMGAAALNACIKYREQPK